MHFRLRYVMDGINLELGNDETVKFAFGGTDAVVVRILRLVDESNAQKATLICEGTCEQKVEESVDAAFQRCSAGVPLDVTIRSFFKSVLSKLFDYMQKTVMTLRWRCSFVDGPTTTFRNGKEAYSFDGAVWQEEPKRIASLKMLIGNPRTTSISEKQCEEIVTLVQKGASEPLEGQLVREAWNLRDLYPKAALVIGVAGAEIGFRRLIGKIAGRKSITSLLKTYWPHPSRIPATQGKQLTPSKALLDSLLFGIHARNEVVHNGADPPNRAQLHEVLTNIGQLLWIWDFNAGHAWALEHLSANST